MKRVEKRMLCCMLCAAMLLGSFGATLAFGAPSVKSEDGFLMVEVEDLPYNSDNMSLTSSANASGEAGLSPVMEDKTEPANDAEPDIDASFVADKAGSYVIWVRQSSAGDTSGRNCFVSLGGGKYSIQTLGGTPDEFVWTKFGTVTVEKAGDTASVRIIRRQKWGIVFDKMIATTNKLYVPTGMGDKPTAPSLDKYEPLPSGKYNVPEIKPLAGHPRVMFTAGDIPAIKANFEDEENQAAYDEWQRLLGSDTDGTLTEAKAGSSNYNAGILANIESFAFDYAVNGNEENGRRAISAIQNYVNSVSFEGYGDPYRIEGHVISIIAQVYDWCYPLISDEEKAVLISSAEAIAKNLEIGYPPSGQSALTSHGCEQSLLCNLLMLGLATYDERPDIYNYVAGRLFDEYIPARNYWSQAHFNHQGTGYGAYRGVWDYWCGWLFQRGTGEFVYSEDMGDVPYMWIYSTRPDGDNLHFGDDGGTANLEGKYQAGDSKTMFLAATLFKDPVLKREAAREMPMFKGFNNLFGYLTPVAFLCFNDPALETVSNVNLPRSKYFASPKGAMIARTGWDDGKDAPVALAYMNIGEMWAANHEHLEVGSFQLYYKGLLASESGMYGAGYNTPHDMNYNKRSVAHNTLAIYDPNETTSYYGTTSNSGGQRVPGNGTELGSLDAWLASDYTMAKVLDHDFGPDEHLPEYTYIKGDITQAYTDKVDEVLRSMVFLPLDDPDHPAAMVVMDKVTASNPNFKKSFLLHTLREPEVSGNRTVVTMDQNGYNGRMVVDTLLPQNVEIEKIGGPGKEFWVGDSETGQNWTAKAEYTDATTHEGQGWGRIEISPAQKSKTDYFLNVMTVGDADSAEPDIESTLIETDKVAGAVFGDRVAVFGKDAARLENSVSFTIPGEGQYKVFVSGIKEGTWATGDGTEVVVTAEGGAAWFEAAAGDVTLTYQNSNTDRKPVVPPVWAGNTEDVIRVRIGGAFQYSDAEPVLVSDRTLVPFRLIFEKLGASVEWNPETASATASKEGIDIVITENDATSYVGGNAKQLDVPAQIVGDRFMVPIRFVAESMGGKVVWDPFANLVDITPGKMPDPNAKPGEAKEGTATISDCKWSSHFEDETGDLTYDGDENTLWSVDGIGEWCQWEFDKAYTVNSAKILFNKATERIAYFELYSSSDGSKFDLIGKFESDGKTAGETFTFDKPVSCKYIKFVGKGNSVHTWSAIKEIEFITQ